MSQRRCSQLQGLLINYHSFKKTCARRSDKVLLHHSSICLLDISPRLRAHSPMVIIYTDQFPILKRELFPHRIYQLIRSCVLWAVSSFPGCFENENYKHQDKATVGWDTCTYMYKQYNNTVKVLTSPWISYWKCSGPGTTWAQASLW